MHLLDLFFPRLCLGCGRIGKYFCPSCSMRIDFLAFQICPYCGRRSIDGMTHEKCQRVYGLDGLHAFLHYRGMVKKAIHLVKFDHVSDLLPEIVHLATSRMPEHFASFNLIVPVPLHRKREKERGYNQSSLIAREISKRVNLPVVKILERKSSTLPQASLNLNSRKLNVRNAFGYTGMSRLFGEKVLLIDDVSTTRMTLIACAGVLKKNGAGSVWGMVLAHG